VALLNSRIKFRALSISTTSSRLWMSEIGGVLGGGWSGGGGWEASQVLRLYSSDSWLRTVGIWRGDSTFDDPMQSWLVAVDRQGRTPEAEATFRGQLEIMRMKGWQTILGVCGTRCMLYSVYAVLGVCWTRCMLYSEYAVLGVCCTRCMLYSVYAVLCVCCTQC